MRLDLLLGPLRVELERLEIQRAVGGFMEVNCTLLESDHKLVHELGEKAEPGGRGETVTAQIEAIDSTGSPTKLTGKLNLLEVDSKWFDEVYDGNSPRTIVRLVALPDWSGGGPRFRVLKAKTLRRVLDYFSEWCDVEESVSTVLAEEELNTEFAIDKNSFLLQAGLSDWAFLCRFFDAASAQFGLPRMGIQARVFSETDVRYEVCWTDEPGMKKQKRKAGVLPGGSLTSRKTLNYEGTSPTHALSQGLDHPVPAPRSQTLYRGTVSPQDAQNYLKQWLPFDGADGTIIDSTTDVFRSPRTREEHLVWASARRAVRPGRSPTSPQGSSFLFDPIVVTGKVGSIEPKSSHIPVTLPDFDSNANKLEARLSPIYSGINGKAGVHFTPEGGTHVWLVWSGRLGDPVLCVGNIRLADMAEESPHLNLEKELVGKLVESTFRSVGLITVQSTLSGKVKQSAQLKVDDKLDVEVKKAISSKSEEGSITLKAAKDIKVDGEIVKVDAKKKLLAKGADATKISGGGKDIKMKSGKVDVG